MYIRLTVNGAVLTAEPVTAKPLVPVFSLGVPSIGHDWYLVWGSS